MKKLLMIATLCLFAIISAPAQNMVKLPAFRPLIIEWDNDNPPELLLSWELFNGTNKVATFTPADYIVLGITNGVSSCRALMPALMLGTNVFTMYAIDTVDSDRSDSSLPFFALGGLLPPRNLRH